MKKNIKIFSLWALTLALAVTLSGCNVNLGSRVKNLTPDQAKAVAEKFINDNLMAPGSKAKIDSITEENGLYKLSVNIGQGQNIDSYLTKDGTKFFPQSLDVKTVEQAAATKNTSTPSSATQDTPAAQDVPKTAKPIVELFVMSQCPYGTQMEKGIIPAVEALGSKVNFAVKFCDYSMHGQKELTEELNQYCIETGQNAKYLTYLKCFLNAGDSASCLTAAKIDTAALTTCVAKTDKQYSVTDNFKNNKDFKGSYPGFEIFKADNEKYNVGGSPTLIINGVESQSGRDSASLLSSICSAFKTAPKECSTKLSSATPAAGFGTGTDSSGGTTGAGCGN